MLFEHISELKRPLLTSEENFPEVEVWSNNPMMVSSLKDTTTKVSIPEPPMSEFAKKVKVGYKYPVYDQTETEKIIFDWYCNPTNLVHKNKMRNIRDVDIVLRVIGEHQGIDKKLYEIPDINNGNISGQILKENPHFRFNIVKIYDDSGTHEKFWITHRHSGFTGINFTGSLCVQEKTCNGFAGYANIIDNESKSIRYANIGDFLVEKYSDI